MYRNLSPGAVGISADLQEGLRLAQLGGFEGLDVPMGEALAIAEREGAQAVRRLYDDAGIRPGGWGLPVPWSAEAEAYRKGLEDLPRYAQLAREIGAPRCVIWIPPASRERAFGDNFHFHVERLRPIAEILDDHDCRLGLEFIGPLTSRRDAPHGFVYSMDGMLALCAAIDTGNVGLLLDAWHWYTARDAVPDLLHLSNADVVYVHVNDAPDGVAVEDQIDNVRRLPGQTGVIDMAGFMGALKSIGYDGPVTPEPFYAPLADMAPEEALRVVAEGMAKIEAQGR